MLSGGRPTGARDAGRPAATNVTPRRPRSGPPRRTPAAAQAVEAQQPPAHGRGRSRLLGALVALLVLVVVVVAIVVATAPGSTQIRLRNVVYSDVQQASTALKQLVSENTK